MPIYVLKMVICRHITCIYYDGAVKQDVARPVTEVNIVKPMNEKAVLSE